MLKVIFPNCGNGSDRGAYHLILDSYEIAFTKAYDMKSVCVISTFFCGNKFLVEFRYFFDIFCQFFARHDTLCSFSNINYSINNIS